MTTEEKLTTADAIYLDSSAIIPITKEEPHSGAVRCLIFGSTLPIYTSYVGFGELIGNLNKPQTQQQVGIGGFLHATRSLMMELDQGLRLKRAEPPEDRVKFLTEVEGLAGMYANLGGADLWHLIAARHLRENYANTGLLTFDKKLAKVANRVGLMGIDGNKLDTDPNRIIEALQAASLYVVPADE